MGDIVKIVTELGSFGLLLGLAGWIIYNHFKNSSEHQKIINVKSEVKEVINESVGELKTSIKTIGDRVTGLEKHINELNPTVPQDITITKPSHPKQFLDRLKLGPQLHKTLNTFRTRINADHIFIGSFHNGNESITGIPYYKFDIIAERFRPDKVERDIEFAFMYKDADLLRHDLLPSEVVQRGVVHYVIDENGKSVLADIDDIIYRRMVGRNIKQLAISLLRDPDGTPSGFVGCVRYDYEDIDLHELKDCGIELENVYAINEKLINSKNNN
jgi:hypothetical protein